jgi:LPXTG-motif cell wall-anchored protein
VLNSATATRGDRLVATGQGFHPGETVIAVLYSQPVPLGQAAADSAGTVRFAFDLPADIAAGAHRATLTGTQSGSASAAFTVRPSPPDTQAGALPATGADITGSAALATLLLLSGVTLIYRRRRWKA